MTKYLHRKSIFLKNLINKDVLSNLLIHYSYFKILYYLPLFNSLKLFLSKVFITNKYIINIKIFIFNKYIISILFSSFFN